MQNEVEDGKNKKSIMGTLKRINAEGGAADHGRPAELKDQERQAHDDGGHGDGKHVEELEEARDALRVIGHKVHRLASGAGL